MRLCMNQACLTLQWHSPFRSLLTHERHYNDVWEYVIGVTKYKALHAIIWILHT